MEKEKAKNSAYSSKDLQNIELITPAKQAREKTQTGNYGSGFNSKLRNRPPPMMELPPNLRTASQVMQYQSSMHQQIHQELLPGMPSPGFMKHNNLFQLDSSSFALGSLSVGVDDIDQPLKQTYHNKVEQASRPRVGYQI